MKLQMMTHGDPHQYEQNNGSVVPMYENSNNSPYYQVGPIYDGQSYLRKYYTPAMAECPYSPITTADALTTTTTTSECNSTNMTNDDLIRVAEEQLRPLIKEELRHTIQCKRVAKGLPSHVEIEYKVPRSEPETPAMVIRRQRRRDRNKVAAAKCRFKKKILSERLIEESEELETQNRKLKTEVQRLQDERQKLNYILNLHRPTCIVRSPSCSSPPRNCASDPRSTSSSPGYQQQGVESITSHGHKMTSSSRSSSLEDDSTSSITSNFTYPPFGNAGDHARPPVHRSVIVRSDSVHGAN